MAIENWWREELFANAALEVGMRLALERTCDETLAAQLAGKLEQRRSRIAQD